MKIVYITAGAAGMYCGSCLLDNALATELLSRGHDVILAPVYTPTLTDEQNVSQERVFFSGISIYLEQHLSIFRRTPWVIDRIWESPWLLRKFSGRGISPDPKLLGNLTVSMLNGESGSLKKEFDKLTRWLRSEPAPDIVHLPNCLLIGMAKPIREALHRPICCTVQGEDLFIDRLQEPFRQKSIELIRSHIQYVDAFLFPSQVYAVQMLSLLSIPPHKVFTVPFGINLSSYLEKDPIPSSPFTLGFFARIAPEKGLHVLCEAYSTLRNDGVLPESRLKAGGYLGLEYRSYLNQITAQMREWGLGGEFNYVGALGRTEKTRFYQTLDVFALPATYDEPKGLSALEAMACGVPVILPRRGTFVEMITKTSGGVLFDPEDLTSLSQAILQLYSDRPLAKQIAANGRMGVREHYSISRMAECVLDIYGAVKNRVGPNTQSSSLGRSRP